MAASTIDDPFELSPVEEVHLERTPLEVVLFQVRLPRPYTPLQDAIHSGAFTQELSRHYPYAETQDVIEFVFQPGQLPTQKPAGSKVLTMSDASQSWTLNVARDSVALTTTAYESRRDLLSRAGTILEALAKTAPPPRVSRVGIRYVNRIREVQQAQDLADSFAPDIQPMQNFSLARLESVQHSMSDLLYAWDQSMKLQARWGILGPGQVVEGALEPLGNSSWVLDIDAFDEGTTDFSPQSVVDNLERLGERAYRFFRWVFTPDALSQFGASE